MQTDQFQLRAAGPVPAHVYRWRPARARGVVQIVHGLAEHAGRYARLAQRLVAAGYAVYAQDLPGHGRSVTAPEQLGHDADHNGWALTQTAIHALREHIGREHPGLPLVILGHSRGSFLLQDYLVNHGTGLRGAVFSAGCGDLGPMRVIGQNLLRLEALWLGRRHRSALAEALTFKDFNRRFKPARTGFDWLSRDAAEVDAYIADPLCGFRASVAVWLDLLAMGGRLDDDLRLARIPQALPVLLLNGSDDPACRGEKGAAALEGLYRDAGLRDVSLRLYRGGRHELFNDSCRDEVTSDLIAWMDRRCA